MSRSHIAAVLTLAALVAVAVPVARARSAGVAGRRARELAAQD